MRNDDAPLSWIATALAAAYVLWSCFLLSRRVPLMADTFSALGAELPAATRLVIALGRPAILWTAAALLVAMLLVKEVTIARGSVRIGISVITFMAVALVVSLANEALVQPMFHLLRQIG